MRARVNRILADLSSKYLPPSLRPSLNITMIFHQARTKLCHEKSGRSANVGRLLFLLKANTLPENRPLVLKHKTNFTNWYLRYQDEPGNMILQNTFHLLLNDHAFKDQLNGSPMPDGGKRIQPGNLAWLDWVTVHIQKKATEILREQFHQGRGSLRDIWDLQNPPIHQNWRRQIAQERTWERESCPQGRCR